MEIYALIGASGTGKSHNAIQVADEYHIDAIIPMGPVVFTVTVSPAKRAKCSGVRSGRSMPGEDTSSM